mmetsp:Transcript_120619/g.276405  ORF Transcript_120619/g.276405 Transcript_120619/m.276405 type:complete len:177 (+) Transcript_120619:190-720(+)
MGCCSSNQDMLGNDETGLDESKHGTLKGFNETMEQMFGDKLLKNGEEPVEVSCLQGKIVGVYFSAHWCPPCQTFTPKLVEFYEVCKTAGHPFEIVFISCDNKEEEFNNYFGSMPWLAMPFAGSDDQRKKALSEKFSCRGIPLLALIDTAAKQIITLDGRSEVMKDPNAKRFPYKRR